MQPRQAPWANPTEQGLSDHVVDESKIDAGILGFDEDPDTNAILKRPLNLFGNRRREHGARGEEYVHVEGESEYGGQLKHRALRFAKALDTMGDDVVQGGRELIDLCASGQLADQVRQVECVASG